MNPATQTTSREGTFPEHAEHVQDHTVTKRFGVEHGEPQTFSTAGDHDLKVPTSGKQLRLKWICIYSDPDNDATCLVNVKWSAGAEQGIYRAPFPAGLGAFAHGGVREGAVDAKLQVNLSTSQTIYVNFGVEEF